MIEWWNEWFRINDYFFFGNIIIAILKVIFIDISLLRFFFIFGINIWYYIVIAKPRTIVIDIPFLVILSSLTLEYRYCDIAFCDLFISFSLSILKWAFLSFYRERGGGCMSNLKCEHSAWITFRFILYL